MVMENHGAEAQYSVVRSLVYAILMENNEGQNNVVHQMIQIGKPSTIRRSLDSKNANGKPLLQILKHTARLANLEWTEEEQAKLQTLVERYTLESRSGAWRVHRWQQASFPVVFGDMGNGNKDSGQYFNEWSLDCLVESPIVGLICDTVLPVLVNVPAEYSKPDIDESSDEVVLHKPENNEHVLPHAPTPQKVVQFCPLPGQVHL